jgi:predicted ATPase/transcriptional regulator with XRE-family HTH domain
MLGIGTPVGAAQIRQECGGNVVSIPLRMFGTLLRSHRERLGLTQDQLARRATMGARTIRNLEAGRVRRPHGHSVHLLSEALELSQVERQTFVAAARLRPTARASRLVAPPDLRAPSTTFLGREQELTDVCLLLRRPGVRCLTLTGSPGAGKTRLALEVAAATAGTYRDGVVAVALGSLTDPAQVMHAVRQALGLAEAGDGSALEVVAAHCQDRHVLLLLDNFEHVLASGPELVELLDRCPDLQALVTSRTALRVRLEHDFAVPPLRSAPSVALFVERAAAAMPGFALTAENTGATAAICGRLGGLPLALELAAPWARLMTPPEILDQLDRQLELLVGGPRHLPQRQRTMRATLAWSCDLLAAEPRALLRRLSVFSGGAPLEVLASVCEAAGTLPGGAFPHLAVLIDHGLVARSEAAGDEARVIVLDSVREYGRELLTAAGESEATALAHLDCYAALAVRSRRELRTGAQASWLGRLRRERDNVRAALEWACERGHAERGLRLAAAMSSFWDAEGQRREGLSWLSRLLEAGEAVEPAVRAEALNAAGSIASHLGHGEQAVAGQRESLRLWRELGDRLGMAEAMRGLGMTLGDLGSHGEAVSLLEESVALLRQVGDRWSLAMALTNLGVCTARGGDRRRATALYEEALMLHRGLDNALGMALCLVNLGHQARIAGFLHLAQTRLEEAVAAGRRLEAPFHLAAALATLADVFRARGEPRAAIARYLEALALFAELGSGFGIGRCLPGLAWAAWTDGQAVRAARLYGAAEALRLATSAAGAADKFFHDRVRAALRDQLGAEAFAAAHEAGGRLSAEAAAAEAAA